MLILRGWTLAEIRDFEAGRRELDRGVEEWLATGASFMLPYFNALKAQIELKAGNYGNSAPAGRRPFKGTQTRSPAG